MNEIIIRESKNNKVKLYIKKIWFVVVVKWPWRVGKNGALYSFYSIGGGGNRNWFDDSQKQMLSRTWIQLVLNY
jgi:hypothetical protein